jgi:hypothetical protein
MFPSEETKEPETLTIGRINELVLICTSKEELIRRIIEVPDMKNHTYKVMIEKPFIVEKSVHMKEEERKNQDMKNAMRRLRNKRLNNKTERAINIVLDSHKRIKSLQRDVSLQNLGSIGESLFIHENLESEDGCVMNLTHPSGVLSFELDMEVSDFTKYGFSKKTKRNLEALKAYEENTMINEVGTQTDDGDTSTRDERKMSVEVGIGIDIIPEYGIDLREVSNKVYQWKKRRDLRDGVEYHKIAKEFGLIKALMICIVLNESDLSPSQAVDEVNSWIFTR